ncbi:MAG: potassium channel family protein [Candidatus Actinomarina sp.]
MNRVKYYLSLLLRVFNNKRLRTVLSFILFFIGIFGYIFFITEPDVKSYSDGLWWALVTITTVGYGDITPLTNLGRLVASALMFLGLGLIASLTAVISVKFIQSFVDHHTNDDVLEKLEEMHKDIDEIKRKIQ